MDSVEILKRLIEFPTFQVSEGEVEDGMKQCAGFLAEYLEKIGFKVRVDDLYNVAAEKAFDGEKTFLLNTHFDTVPPSNEWKDALTPRLEGDRLYGLGASDAKGGIAATLSVLSRLENCRFAKLIVQFVNYEDNNIVKNGKRLLGTPYWLENNPDFKADFGINIEPTVIDEKWTISLGCTGRVAFSITTHGKEAHSSTPHKGKNAIYDMVKIIEALRAIPPGRFRLDWFEGEMPINVATIAGGRAINIVPGECKITCERRVFPNEHPEELWQSIREAIEKVKDVNAECVLTSKIQLPYMVDRNNENVQLIADSFSKTLEYKPPFRVGLGRTDSMYLYHNAGVKTVIAGPGHTGHVVGENINVERMKEFATMLENLLRKK
jgi:acetylornithine deacetylase/succinyl-diaminopimelate desuccinylase-like protein